MNTDLPYWVALHHAKGLGAVRFRALLTTFGTMQAAWNANPSQWRSAGLPERVIESLLTLRNQIDPLQLRARIEASDIQIITQKDPCYPALLNRIDTPPPLLYCRGTMPITPEPCIAIVGTRKMTAYGRQMAQDIATFLGAHGFTIVSGLARGVDGIAHQAALKISARTIAILGSGVDVLYPPEHRALAEQIIKNGAILSDYPPGTQPERTNFPPRNRIISGISAASVIIEAGEKSGSLITARFAAEQGREVFVVPGNLTAPQSVGTNQLIHDGARPLVRMEDLLDFMQSMAAVDPLPISKPIQMSFEDPAEQRLIELIALEPKHVDVIAREMALPANKIASMLMMLELKGFIIETSPQMYQKNQKWY